MKTIKTYYRKVILHDIINKFNFKLQKNKTKITEISIHFGYKTFNIQELAAVLLALEIIANKRGKLTVSKKANIILKIQKGQPSGCKVVLKKKEIFFFITKLLLEIFPNTKNMTSINLIEEYSSFFIKIPSRKIVLPELNNQYPLFAKLPNLEIQFKTNAEEKKNLIFLAKSLKIPITTEMLDKWSRGLRR